MRWLQIPASHSGECTALLTLGAQGEGKGCPSPEVPTSASHNAPAACACTPLAPRGLLAYGKCSVLFVEEEKKGREEGKREGGKEKREEGEKEGAWGWGWGGPGEAPGGLLGQDQRA